MNYQKLSIASLCRIIGNDFPGSSGGAGRGSLRLKSLTECMNPNWNLQRGRGAETKTPIWGVWISSGTGYLSKATNFNIIILRQRKMVKGANI